MLYKVTFVQLNEYEVEAKSEEEAEDKAYEEFSRDMHRAVAHTDYDYAEVEEIGEDDAEKDWEDDEEDDEYERDDEGYWHEDDYEE